MSGSDGVAEIAAWVAVGLSGVALLLSIRHERLLRGQLSVDSAVETDAHSDEPQLLVWVACNHGAVGLREIRLYRGRPRGWKYWTHRQEREPGPNFHRVSGDTGHLVVDKPLVFKLAQSDYRQYGRKSRKGKRQWGTHVGVRSSDGHRYASRVPREFRHQIPED